MKFNSLPFNTTTLKDKKHVFHWREFYSYAFNSPPRQGSNQGINRLNELILRFLGGALCTLDS